MGLLDKKEKTLSRDECAFISAKELEHICERLAVLEEAAERQLKFQEQMVNLLERIAAAYVKD